MYTIEKTGERVRSFSKAVEMASAISTNVLGANGMVRWTPALDISTKAMRRYRNRMAAYKAQCRMLAR